MATEAGLKDVALKALGAAHTALKAKGCYLKEDPEGNTDRNVQLAAALLKYEAAIEAAKFKATGGK